MLINPIKSKKLKDTVNTIKYYFYIDIHIPKVKISLK